MPSVRSGTLMMYVGCPSYYDDVGRGVLTAEQEREVLEKHPPFDPITTRSARSHGVLVEFFRTFPGTLVNDHVARFAAAGAHAVDLLAEHPWNLPYGAGSPLDRFRTLGGSILLLGSDHDEVTFLHHVEHVVDFPDKKISRYKVPCEDGGRVVWRDVEEVNTAGDGAHAIGRTGFSRRSSMRIWRAPAITAPASATPLAISSQRATFTVLPDHSCRKRLDLKIPRSKIQISRYAILTASL